MTPTNTLKKAPLIDDTRPDLQPEDIAEAARDLATHAAETARDIAEEGLAHAKAMAPVATETAREAADWSRSNRGRNTLFAILAGAVTIAVIVAIVRTVRARKATPTTDAIEGTPEGSRDHSIRAA